MLTVHLFNHENSPEARIENNIAHLHEHLRWDNRFAEKTVRKSVRGGLITLQNNFLSLTDAGRNVAKQALVM
jgi:manganese/zinc/iron transport system permease protein